MLAAAAALAQGRRGPALSPAARQATQLDLDGQGAKARGLWEKVLEAAKTPAEKAAAERNIAISWAFSGNCGETMQSEKDVIAYWATQEKAQPANAFYQQGEMADEAGRVCFDLGQLDAAEQMYTLGHTLGLKQPGIPAGRRDLWDFRFQHALARLAAARHQPTQAGLHVALARSALDKMKTDDPKLYQQQAPFFPQLAGAVAYYEGHYPAALADFQKVDHPDAYVTAMIGMCQQKLGHMTEAKAAFEQAAKARGHNPPAAFARRAAANFSASHP